MKYFKKNGYKLQDFFKKIIFAISVFLVFFFISKVISFFVKKTKYLKNKNKVFDKISKNILLNFISRVISFIIIIIGLFISLSIMGLNTGSILVIMGSLGIGIALALKDFLTECVSGLVVIALNYYNIGDVIKINDTIGVVSKFDLLNTSIIDFQNVVSIIPNNSIVGSEFTNYSKEEYIFVSMDICLSNSKKTVNYKKIFEELTEKLKDLKYCENKEAKIRISKMDEQGTVIRPMMKVKGENFFVGTNELSLYSRDFLEKKNILLCDFNCVDFLE